MSTLAGIGASVLALAAGEADAQFACQIRAPGGWVHRNYIPFGYAGDMIIVRRGIPFSGTYFGGHFTTGRLHIDFSSYEAVPQPVFYPAPLVREYVAEYPLVVHERRILHEERTARHYPRGVTEEDGEDALYRALGGRGEFRWKKYVRACDGQFLQVDAVVGRKIIDVVPTEEEARRRSWMLPGYEYVPIVVNDFGSADEIRGAVKHETR